MPVTNNAPAPYAPTVVILSLLERNRSKGLPAPVDAETLTRAGVSESLVSRVLYALKILDLIDENGQPTQILEQLRLAPEGEYRTRMAEWLKAAYADALWFIDLNSPDQVRIRDAFRSYKPVGQQDRMVSLFMGLFQEAGLLPEGAKPRSKSPSRSVEVSRRGAPTNITSSAGLVPLENRSNQLTQLQLNPNAISPNAISEKALEYRLVDLMSDAAGEPKTLHAIIEVLTWLKTRHALKATSATEATSAAVSNSLPGSPTGAD